MVSTMLGLCHFSIELSFTRSTEEPEAEEVVDLEDVEGPEMVAVTEAESEEDHQVEEGGDSQHHPTDWDTGQI